MRKTLWSDEHTTITQTHIRTTIKRHYSDIPDVVTYITNETADQLINDMLANDMDDNAVPSHYLTRHIKDLYPTIR